jgi:hypothetical protein
MKLNWLGTTAVALLIGTGAVVAQSQNEQKREEGPRAQQSPSKDAEPGERGKGRAAQPESKGGKESQRGEPPSDRKQAQDRDQQQGRDAKERSKQSEEQQKGRDAKQPESKQSEQDRSKQDNQARDAKQPADAKQQQSQQPQPKQDNQARDAKQPADAKQQQGQQQPGQTQQPPTQSSQQGTQPGDTQQNRQQGQTTGQSSDPSRRDSTSVQVNQEQRSQIVDRLRRERSTSRENINIQVNVGDRLPPRVRPRPLPPDIVRIAPQYRGYEYTVVQDRIYVVEPRTRRVVDVVEESGPSSRTTTTSTYRGGNQRITISNEQRETLKQSARRMTSSPSSASPSGSVSDASCLTLQPVPEELVRVNPEFGNYRMLAIGEQVILVDPREQKVVEVID